MSNATENLIDAEKMIRSTITGVSEQNRAIRLFKLFLSFNGLDDKYRIKCYTREDASVRLCIDSGSDCDSEKIGTSFLNIKSNFQYGILTSATKYTYLKAHDRNWSIISGPTSRDLSDDTLLKHVMESFLVRMSKMSLKVHDSILKTAKI